MASITHDHAFMRQLQPGDFVVEPYGRYISSARYNGVYYDSMNVSDKDGFSGNDDFRLAGTLGKIKVYRKSIMEVGNG